MDDNSDADDGFVKVGRSGRAKKSKSKSQVKVQSGGLSASDSLQDCGPSKENIMNKLKTSLDDVRCSDYFKHTMATLQEHVAAGLACTEKRDLKIICLGLGNFGVTIGARCQFAFLQLVVEALAKENICVCVDVFDPCFTTQEKLVISTAGFNILTSDVAGQHVIDGKTLFYMPHCPRALYNNVIWANWNVSSLQQIIILGNSFAAYMDADTLTNMRSLVAIFPAVIETALPNTFIAKVVFNNLALHHFSAASLDKISLDVWNMRCDAAVVDH
eukprot:m.38370 g.38370  ORF g.38370 m.38370 type:complete len:273 (+) comp17900_c0_seq1:243-1061(+)